MSERRTGFAEGSERMRTKTLSGTVLILLLIGTLLLEFNIQRVKASGTIYIRADGSVDPDTAPISSVDNVTYTFTGNISIDNSNDGIVIQRDNILVDGTGYTLQGSKRGNGLSWSSVNNVTIKNTNIEDFWIGVYLLSTFSNVISGNNITNNYISIYLRDSSNNSISKNKIENNEDSIMLDWSSKNNIFRNNITNNGHGIYLNSASYNSISGNSITNNNYYGIWLKNSSNNNIPKNNIVKNNRGVRLYVSSNNNIPKNNIANNYYGIWIEYSSNNTIYYNNFVDNTDQVYCYNSTNVWNIDYPSGGNYWSDCTAVDADEDGIGDTAYVIDPNNTDRYPLMELWSCKNNPPDGDIWNFLDKFGLLAAYIGLVLTIILAIVATAVLVKHKKKR